MKLLWLTDLHLEGPSVSVREALYKSMERQRPEAVVITGDIAESGRPESELENLADRFPAAEIYFVLGNHDFFGSSFAETDRRMAELCGKHGNLHHLVGDTIVPLGDDTALIGHRGWGDARTGWGAKTWLANPDFGQIQDFCHLSKTRRFEKLYQLGDESADALRSVLPYAFKCYRRVIIATHVPPFTESALFNNEPCRPTRLPFFVNAGLGRLIYRMAGLHPRCQITVLAGHTHSPVTVDIKDNLRVRVGAGRTGGTFYTMLTDEDLALKRVESQAAPAFPPSLRAHRLPVVEGRNTFESTDRKAVNPPAQAFFNADPDRGGAHGFLTGFIFIPFGSDTPKLASALFRMVKSYS